MPTDEATGQVPGGTGQEPGTQTTTTTTGAAQDAGDEWGDNFDAGRARTLIAKLRSEAKRASAAIKEADELRQAKAQAEDQKLGDLERRDKRIQQLEAEMATSKHDAQERALEYAVEREAAKLNLIDPEAARLLVRREDLELDRDGRPTNVAAVLADLVTQRPYLAGQTPAAGSPLSTGNPATRAAAAGQRTYKRADLQNRDFWDKHKDDIKLALREGRITD